MERRRKGKTVFPVEPWAVTETDFPPEHSLVRETLFTLSNGYLGLRGALEEGVQGAASNPGTHLAGVFYRKPDHSAYAKGPRLFSETEHAMATFADVLRVRPRVGAETLDLLTSRVTGHRRRLDLKTAVLERAAVWTPQAGGRLRIRARRFVPMPHRALAVLRYEIEALEPAELRLEAGIEKCAGTAERGIACWAPGGARRTGPRDVLLRSRLPASGFEAAAATDIRCRLDGDPLEPASCTCADNRALLVYAARLEAGQRLELELRAAVLSTRDTEAGALEKAVCAALGNAEGGEALLDAHASWWRDFWAHNDIVIEGDDAVQQGIRYCLFQIAQSRQPGDERLSIGTNGLTGAMHGGLYFWDTEVYLLPPLLHMNPGLARELLDYRFHTLDRARQQARALRYRGAMYPWLTITGEPGPGFYDCTIGEQHINAAIPYAIDRYLDATEDDAFLRTRGADILIEQARFWADRVCWNARKGAYVINQATGPDEYTVFNNNNCYTNTMARWTLRFAADSLDRLRGIDAEGCRALETRLELDPAEPAAWRRIADALYIPYDQALGIHPQDEAFLDLDPVDFDAIPETDLPLESHWPWERLMRSRVIKQPDVLLLEHLRHEEFRMDQKEADYAFYEPLTIHDSSLSPSIHALVAAEIGRLDDAAYYLYRAVRLDLNNINRNTGAGIHLANCGGAWMAVVHGLAGLRFRDGIARFAPVLPPGWRRIAFRLLYRGRRLRCELTPERGTLALEDGAPLAVTAPGLPGPLSADRPLTAV